MMMVVHVVQTGGERMPTEEERVCPLSGKPSRRIGKPEQNSDRGT